MIGVKIFHSGLSVMMDFINTEALEELPLMA